MTSDFPAPLVPSDVNLSEFASFLLNVDKILSSELVALATPEEGWAAFLLWCRAWKQTPPGSLPDDDRVLASFSGAGKRWSKVKAMALRNFVKCSDGRLYHDTLAEVANEAFARKIANAKKREKDADRLRNWRERNAHETRPETPHETRFETRSETGSVGVGIEVKRKELQNRGSVVSQPSTATQPVDNPANPAIEKIEPRKTNGKGDGNGQRWDDPVYVAASAEKLGVHRRENEQFKDWRDRVYTTAQQLRREARH